MRPWPCSRKSGWVDSDGDGVREKDGGLLEFTVSYSDIVKYFETTAIVMQDQLSEIGFKVNVEKLEWSSYVPFILSQGYDVTPLSNTIASAPDPNQFTSNVVSTGDVLGGGGSNLVSYVNPRVDELVDAGVRVPGCDNAARAEIYNELQQILYDDVAIHFTLSPSFYQLAAKSCRQLQFLVPPGPSMATLNGYKLGQWINNPKLVST